MRPRTPDDGLFAGLLGATLARATLPDLATYLGSGRPAPNAVLELTTPARAASSFCSALLIALALGAFVTRRRTDGMSSAAAWLWLAYLGDQIVSTALQGHFAVSTAVVSLATLLAVALLDLDARQAARSALTCLTLVSVASLVLAVVDPTVARYTIGSGSWFSRDARLAGVFSTPNEMANAAALTIVVAIAGWALLSRWLRVLGLLSGALALLLTESYTAMIAVGVCLLGAWTVLRHSAALRRTAGLVVVLTSAAVVTVAGIIASSSSLSERAVVWTYVRTFWTQHSYVGHGASSWAGLIADQQVPSWAVHAHDQLLNSLWETGLLGLAICVAALGGSLWITSRHSGLPRDARSVAYLVLLLEGIRGVTEVPFEAIWGGVDLAVVLVVVATAAGPSTGHPDSADPPPERSSSWEPSFSSTSTPELAEHR